MEQIIWKTSWFAIVSHALYVHRDVKMRKCSFCDWNIINCTQSIDVRTNSMDLFWNCGYCLELLFYYSCIKKQFAFYFTFFSFDFAKSIYGHSLLFVIWVLLLFVFWGWSIIYGWTWRIFSQIYKVDLLHTYVVEIQVLVCVFV